MKLKVILTTFLFIILFSCKSQQFSLGNLNTNNINTVNASTNEKAISLMKNTSYEWCEVSKAAGSNLTPSNDKW
ncbi:hypothetical protein [uncultured Maribacter sp.]|uniref:hypothetical protein n=1 Tax=uncultured Maribacter sp. TaxID=431308 RepID=UPI0026236BA8|nr:hypothetical protein [uncultured Maribacter sp.]